MRYVMQHGLLRNRQISLIEKFDGGLWSVMQGRTCALASKMPLVPTLQSYTDMRIKVAGPTVAVFCQRKVSPRAGGQLAVPMAGMLFRKPVRYAQPTLYCAKRELILRPLSNMHVCSAVGRNSTVL